MSNRTRQQTITAFIYDKRGRLLSMGRNSYVKTHPLQARIAAQVGEDRKIFLHAEIAALVRCKDWTKMEKMTVVRLNKEGRPLPAKPCSICQEAIKQSGIKYVEYT